MLPRSSERRTSSHGDGRNNVEAQGHSEDAPPATVIFVHIAKTAGSTFVDHVGSRLLNGNVFAAYETTLAPEKPSGTGVYEAVVVARKVQELEKDQAAPFPFILGHMRFGLHEHLLRPASYVTFLRNPIDRMTSAFNYVKKLGWLAESATIESFCAEGFLGNSDAMVRQLINDPSLDSDKVPALEIDARAVTSSDVDRALQNIEDHFLFAAPTGEFDTALYMMLRHFGFPLRLMFYRKVNVRNSEQVKPDLPEHTRNFILDHNRGDTRLFDEQSIRFRRSKASMDPKERRALETITHLTGEYRLLEPLISSLDRRAEVLRTYEREADAVERELNAWQQPKTQAAFASPLQRNETASDTAPFAEG